MHICLFLCASMALIQSEIVRPQVITAKCSELQADTIKVEVKEIRIIPKADARFFEIQYIYEAECNQRNLNKSNALALDLGMIRISFTFLSSSIGGITISTALCVFL